MLRVLIWKFLKSHPAHSHSASALQQEVDRLAAADGAPPVERQASQQYAELDLRQLVRRAQAAPGTLVPREEPAPLKTTLPNWLLQREAGRWWSSRSASVIPTVSAELRFGTDRFGLRGVVDGHLGAAYCVAWDVAGERAITGADDGLIKVWCTRTCLLLGTLYGHKGEITELSVSAPGSETLLASASNDGDVRVWTLSSVGFPCVATISGGVASPIAGTSFRPPRPTYPAQLLMVMANGTLSLCTDVSGHAEDLTASETSAPPAITGAVTDGWFTVSTRTPVKSAEGFFVFEGAWSPGGTRFAVGTTDEVVHVYRVPPPSTTPCASGVPQLVATLRGHRHDVTSISWSNKGDALLSGSKDGTARLWRLKGRAGNGHVLGNTATLVSYPGERWGSTLLGETPWTVANPNPVLPVIGAVAWSADDSLLVTSRSDAKIFVWCGRTGAALRELGGEGLEAAHAREVYVLKCHPTLPHVAISASYDGSAVVWDVRTGALLRRLRQPVFDDDNELIDGSWGGGGELLAFTDTGGRLTIWGHSLSASPPALLHKRLEQGEVRAMGATCLAASTVAPLQQFYRADLSQLAVASETVNAHVANGLVNPNPVINANTILQGLGAARAQDRTLVDKLGRAYGNNVQRAATQAANASLAVPPSAARVKEVVEARYGREDELLNEFAAQVVIKPAPKRNALLVRAPPALACEREPAMVSVLAQMDEPPSDHEEDKDEDYGDPAHGVDASEGDSDDDSCEDDCSDEMLSDDDLAVSTRSRSSRRLTRSSVAQHPVSEGRTVRRRTPRRSVAPAESTPSQAGNTSPPREQRRRLVRAADAGGAGVILGDMLETAPAVSVPTRRASTLAAEERLQLLRASGILEDDSDVEGKRKRRRRSTSSAAKRARKAFKVVARRGKSRRPVVTSSEEEESFDEAESSEREMSETHSEDSDGDGTESAESGSAEAEGGGKRRAKRLSKLAASGLARTSTSSSKRSTRRRSVRRVATDEEEDEEEVQKASESSNGVKSASAKHDKKPRQGPGEPSTDSRGADCDATIHTGDDAIVASDGSAAADEGAADPRGGSPEASRKLDSDGSEGQEESATEGEYEVEMILSQRTRRGRREYLVQWKGFGDDHNTWEPEGSLKGCGERLSEFLDTVAHNDGQPTSLLPEQRVTRRTRSRQG